MINEIPCEFCNLMVRADRVYSHVATCSGFINSSSNRNLRSRAIQITERDSNSVMGSSPNNRYMMSDILFSLCRNERLDSINLEEMERRIDESFDQYDEIDARLDQVLSVSRSVVLRPPSNYQVVPYVNPINRSSHSVGGGAGSYDDNMRLADRIGRVTIGVKNIRGVLKRIDGEEPILCPICQDLCQAIDAMRTECLHDYCETCISRWLAQSKYCPVCKHEFIEQHSTTIAPHTL